MFRMRFALFLFVLLTSRRINAIQEPRCYWPDGSIDTSGYVCNLTAVSTGGASACCLHNDACYASGSCFQDWSGVAYRQSCTDPSWRDPACPNYCLGQGLQSISVWMQTCDMKNGKACCLVGDSCCNDTSKWFSWKPGYISAVINGDGTNRLMAYVSANGSTQATGSSPSTSSTSSSTTSAAGNTQPTGASDNCQSSSPSNHRKASSGTNNAAIAVGVVSGVLLMLSAAGLVFLWQQLARERKMRLGEETTRRHMDAHELPVDGIAGKNHMGGVELPGNEIIELPPKPGEGSTYGGHTGVTGDFQNPADYNQTR